MARLDPLIKEDTHTIRLQIEGRLEHRDLVLRVVAAACRLACLARGRADLHGHTRTYVLSAVGEAFNNIALHGYRDRPMGNVEIEIAFTDDRLAIALSDWGTSFDPCTVPPPDLDSLPESGMGVFIMRSFVDEIQYAPGAPNVLTLIKRLPNVVP